MSNFNVQATEAICVGAPKQDELLDILIQNHSANSIYWGHNPDVSIVNGVEIVAGAVYANDKCGKPMYVIAAAADSDVRVEYEIFKAGTR